MEVADINRVGNALTDKATRVVNKLTFAAYCLFTLDYYVRISARVPGLGSLRPTLVLFVFIIGLLIAQRDALKGKLAEKPSAALVVLLVYIALSLPFTTWPGSVVNNLEAFAKAASFFFFTVLIVDTRKRFFVFLSLLVSTQLVRVLEPLYLNLTIGYLGDRTYLGDGEFAGRLAGAPSDVINPNGLGFVTVTCIPYLYYCLFAAKPLYRKVLALALMGACAYVLVLTMSRGAMVAFAVVLWMIFTASKHKVLFVAAAAAFCIVGWGLLDDVHKERYVSLFDSNTRQSTTAEGRIDLTKFEFEVGMQAPIFGHGLGTTPEAKAHSNRGAQAAHNLYTELLIEVGLVGGLLFLSFIYSVRTRLQMAAQLIAHGGHSDSDIAQRLVQCFTALFWMYAVFSMNYFGLSQDYWYVLAGLVAVFVRQAVGETAPVPAELRGGRRPATRQSLSRPAVSK